MRSEQLDAMSHPAGLNMESFLEALHQLKANFYSQRWRVRDGLDQFASAIVPYMVYCYVPGLPEEIPIIHLLPSDGGPRLLIAYPKENIQHFDPVVHLQAVYEGVRCAIRDLAGEQTGKNYQYKLGRVTPEIAQYLPGEIIQLLAKIRGYDDRSPTRCSRCRTANPGLEASLQRSDKIDDVSLNCGLTDTPRFTELMRRSEMSLAESVRTQCRQKSFFIQ